jgi:ankyrin repeat protein
VKENRYGSTSLNWVARNWQYAVVKLLLEAKADVNVKDSEWVTGSIAAASPVLGRMV